MTFSNDFLTFKKWVAPLASGVVCYTVCVGALQTSLFLPSGCHTGIIGNNRAVIARVNYSEGTRGGWAEGRKRKDDKGGIEIQSK